MRKYIFVPDLIKFEEEFILEGSSVEEVLKKLSVEFPYNSMLAMYEYTAYGRYFIGVVSCHEGDLPYLIGDDRYG